MLLMESVVLMTDELLREVEVFLQVGQHQKIMTIFRSHIRVCEFTDENLQSIDGISISISLVSCRCQFGEDLSELGESDVAAVLYKQDFITHLIEPMELQELDVPFVVQQDLVLLRDVDGERCEEGFKVHHLIL